MVFVGQNRRAGRSAPPTNSTFPAIIIPEHRAKTPRTEKEEKKEKKKNLGPKLPKTPFSPPHSDIYIYIYIERERETER